MVLERNLVIIGLYGDIRLHVPEAKQELGHADTDGMLTDLAHILEVQLEHSLQLEFVLEVVDDAGCVTDTHLLVDRATYQVLVDVVLQPDRSDVVQVVQHLLQ